MDGLHLVAVREVSEQLLLEDVRTQISEEVVLGELLLRIHVYSFHGRVVRTHASIGHAVHDLVALAATLLTFSLAFLLHRYITLSEFLVDVFSGGDVLLHPRVVQELRDGRSVSGLTLEHAQNQVFEFLREVTRRLVLLMSAPKGFGLALRNGAVEGVPVDLS